MAECTKETAAQNKLSTFMQNHFRKKKADIKIKFLPMQSVEFSPGTILFEPGM